jgi:hypothetical protein
MEKGLAMRRMAFSLIVAATLGATAPAQAGPLDALLDGFDDGCHYTDAFDDLLQSSYLFARKEGAIVIPPAHAADFGQPVVRPDDEYLHITLPVIDASWRGVPVKEIEVYITELASDFVYHAVIFDPAATDAAAKTFTERGVASKVKLNTGDGPELDTGFSALEGGPRYYCDLSG